MVLVLEQFVRNLRESRLIPAEEVASLHKALQASKTPHSVEDVVKMLVQNGKLTAYQAEAISQGRPQTLILGEYVIMDVLGKGGMGVVFRARHRLMDRVVALKMLSMTAIKPDTVQRFFREVKAAARLSHPNIVTAYDAGEHAGTHYLVMEYVVGRDLAAIVKEKGPLPLRQAIDYSQQAARGLEFAHKHGVVHRDVKPGNLLLDQEGVVKILDMGLARLSENLGDVADDHGYMVPAEITSTGQILGTIDYMSPEQAEDVRSADHRSDIYSLGCTLFYLLTRRPVYSGETVIKRILAHRNQPIPSVTELRPDCPATLDAALRRMLAKRPEDRPQTMAEIIAELDGCLEKPGAAPPPADHGYMVPESPERSESARNWLEDLVHEDAPPNTEDSQAQNATLGLPTEDDVHSRPPRISVSGSAIRRSKPQPHRPGAKKSPATRRRVLGTPGGARGRTWQIVTAATIAAVIIVAVVVALIFNRFGGDSTAANKESGDGKPKTAGPATHNDAKNGPLATPAHQPDPSLRGTAWEQAWNGAEGRAKPLIDQQRFAEAIGEYSTLADRFPDPLSQQQCHDAIHRIEAKADAAYGKVETVVREHIRQKQFRQARAALKPALETYGPVPALQRSKKLLEEINRAERQAPDHGYMVLEAVKPSETPDRPETPEIPPELRKQRQLEATYAKAMAAVEGRVAGWDFPGALRESEKVRFDSLELTARLTDRRKQIQRMADLKDRMTALINQADPPLKKTDLALRGINGELNKADAEGITATLPNGKTELLAWPELGPKAMSKILPKVLRREDPGDWLAAGLLGLLGQPPSDQFSGPTAEKCFDKAQSLGAETAPYRALLAAKDFSVVRNMVEKQRYAESQPLLAALEEKYGKLPWFSWNKPEFDAAAEAVKRGLREKEAEQAYRQAAGLYRDGDLYELKPLVERLKTQYADSAVAADSQRKPSLAELEKAVADLGPLVRVRKDGSGDAKTIQDAVKNALPGTTIRVDDVGPWTEVISVPLDKEGLTISGKRGILPVITTVGTQKSYAETLVVHSRQMTLERLMIVRDDSGGAAGNAIYADKTVLVLREVIVCGHIHAEKLDARQSAFTGKVRIEGGIAARDSAFLEHVDAKSACDFQNVLVHGGANCGADSRFSHCTIAGPLQLSGMAAAVSDCIVSKINAGDSQTIDHCDVFGDDPNNGVTPGKGCLTERPKFVDAKNFDYRLLPGSPCRKAASDGADMGIKHTPEIQAMLKSAERQNRSRH